MHTVVMLSCEAPFPLNPSVRLHTKWLFSITKSYLAYCLPFWLTSPPESLQRHYDSQGHGKEVPGEATQKDLFPLCES